MMLINFSNRLISIVMLFLYSMAIGHNVAYAKPIALPPLNKVQVEQHTAMKKKVATVSMIFQPNCSWCKKQGQLLAKAFEQCHSIIDITFIGTRGDKRALKHELKHYHHAIPAFMADRQFMREIGGFQASPTTLFYDSNGKLVAKKRGFIKQAPLFAALAFISKEQCQIEL